jgi:APA family basic amino acid/polyamine antiporter
VNGTTTKLLRSLGRVDALAIGIGSVIGVGIFRTTGLVVAATGGPMGATAIWLGVGVVSALGALVYGDLSTRVPEAGGPYAYVRDAFGRATGFADGWLHAGVSVPARQAAGFAAIGEVLSELGAPGPPRALASGVLVALMAVNLAGVRSGAIAQRALTVAKLIAIAAVMGLVLLPARYAPSTALPVSGSWVTAVAGVWYAFLGWQDVALLAEEIRDPRRDLPFVLLATVLVVTAVYVAFQGAIFVGLGGSATAASDLPALRLAETRFGAAGGRFLGAVALLSMVGGVAEGLLVRPRIAFAMARDGLAPRVLARVDRRGTPWAAMLAHGVLVLGLVATGTFERLLLLLVFSQALTGLLEALSWFRIARRREAVVRCPGAPWVPLGFAAANGALCVAVAVESPGSFAFTIATLGGLGAVGVLVARRNRTSS